jgi:hypothetical protein
MEIVHAIGCLVVVGALLWLTEGARYARDRNGTCCSIHYRVFLYRFTFPLWAVVHTQDRRVRLATSAVAAGRWHLLIVWRIYG